MADLGEKVHLRLVPPPGIDEASRATTAAELARHLVSIGIEPTDENVWLAASMLGAGLPITYERFATVARLAQGTNGDLGTTGAAAAYIVRHGLDQDQATLMAICSALFESPSLGELLTVLEAAAASDRTAPQAEALRAGICRCLSEVRSGGPAEWLCLAAGLCGVDFDLPAHGADLGPLLVSSLDGSGTLADAVRRLRALRHGLRVVNDAPASNEMKNWVLQVPFSRRDGVGTSFVQLEMPDGPLNKASLARHCDARLWVPLEENVVRAHLRVRQGRAAAALHVGGSEEGGAVSGRIREWLAQALSSFGITVSRVSVSAGQDGDLDGPAEQPVPMVGLDFEV
ncbi:MAG: hypothetical protein JW889_01535 [Verrucomicrobia bacterium]|nr:hypothetical protein [Verrucomicrobiota bacterium]